MAKWLRPGNLEQREVCIVVVTFLPDITGINFFFLCFFHAQTYIFLLFTGKKSCPDAGIESSTEIVPVSSSPPPSARAPRPTADDPYAVFLAEQKKREKEWASNRAAKMAKVIPTESPSEPSGSQCDEMSYVKKQLNAKNEECAILKNQLRDLQQANADAVKDRRETQEKFCKVGSKVSN